MVESGPEGAGGQPQPWADRPGQRQVGNSSPISVAAALVSEDMSTLIPDSTACCTWTPNQVVFPHPGGPTTRYSTASVSVFFTDGIVFSLLHAGCSSRLSVENRLDPLYI